MKDLTYKKAAAWIILSALCLLLSGCTPPPDIQSPLAETRHDKWVTDITFLTEQLPKRHKNLFFKLDSADFYEEAERIKESVDELTDDELRVAVSRLIASVGDGHTIAYPRFPIHVSCEAILVQRRDICLRCTGGAWGGDNQPEA